MMIGTHIEETGIIIRDGSGYALRRDLGGRYRLDLHRVAGEHVDERVRITGTIVEDGLVDVDTIKPD